MVFAGSRRTLWTTPESHSFSSISLSSMRIILEDSSSAELPGTGVQWSQRRLRVAECRGLMTGGKTMIVHRGGPRMKEDKEFRVNKECLQQPSKVWRRRQYGRCGAVISTLSYNNVSLTLLVIHHIIKCKFIEHRWWYIVHICLTLAKGKTH